MKRLGFYVTVGLSTFGCGVLVAAIWTACLQYPSNDDSKVVLFSPQVKLRTPPSATSQDPQPSSSIMTSTFELANQPIRSVNFCYVAFPRYPVYVGYRGEKKYVTLKPGDACPASLNYGDVTGDGVEEAMMVSYSEKIESSGVISFGARKGCVVPVLLLGHITNGVTSSFA